MLPLLEADQALEWEMPATEDLSLWSQDELDEAARQCLEVLAGRRRGSRVLYPKLEELVRLAAPRILSDLLAALREARDPEALNVLEGLASQLEPGFLPLLGKELLDPAQPEAYRCSLARAIAHLDVGPEARVTWLLQGMRESVPAVRGACAEAAGYAGLTPAVAALSELAQKDPDSYVREAATMALDDLAA